MYASLSKGDLIEMNNKKLSSLLEPNLKLYFLCMIVFAAATATVSLPLGLVEIACTVGLYAYFTNRNQKRRQNILQYIDNVTGSVDTASKSTLINSPLPIMVFRPDTGEVIWSNENFLQLAGVREHLFEMKVEDAVPDFPVQWLLEGKQECPDRVVMNSRRSSRRWTRGTTRTEVICSAKRSRAAARPSVSPFWRNLAGGRIHFARGLR